MQLINDVISFFAYLLGSTPFQWFFVLPLSFGIIRICFDLLMIKGGRS